MTYKEVPVCFSGCGHLVKMHYVHDAKEQPIVYVRFSDNFQVTEPNGTRIIAHQVLLQALEAALPGFKP